MRAAKPIAAILAAAAVLTFPASTVADTGAMNVHLINAVGFPRSYIKEVKADVENAYWHNGQPIQFSSKGNKVYLETPAQREAEGSFFNGTVYCFHSQVGPDPDATVTSTATPEGDAASVTLAVSMIQNAHCLPGP